MHCLPLTLPLSLPCRARAGPGMPKPRATSPRAEVPSLAAWTGLESRTVSTDQRPPCQGAQRWIPPGAGWADSGRLPLPWGLRASLPGFAPLCGRGCSAACGQKMAALHCLSPARLRGRRTSPSLVCRVLGRVLCPPSLWVGTTALAGPHRSCGSRGLRAERQKDHCILEAVALASIPELLPTPPGSLLFGRRTVWG